MGEVLERIAASLLCTTLFCLMTIKTLGVMQQGGYKSGAFLRWLAKRENMLFNRLCVLALCLALSCAITALCFSFLGIKTALVISALPFTGLLFVYLYSDQKRALKVAIKKTGRISRLFVCYFVFVLCFSYLWIALLKFLAIINGSLLYGLIAYVPFALLVPALPFILCLANAFMGAFENARNRKFVKGAGQVLDEKKIVRIGIVGSYGKTSVKNILKTVLEEKYAVVATPQSYNTPIGIAKTVQLPEFENAQILIAEMGARRKGDIAELCELVKPDFAIFTGVCEQHIQTFGSVENVFAEKSEIIKSGAFVVCNETLKARVEDAFEKEYIDEAVTFAGCTQVEDLQFLPTQTKFVLRLGEERIEVCTRLLGRAAVENIALACTLAYECLGLAASEIARGVQKICPVPHRLELIESGGAYILDDGYNANIVGAREALYALSRFTGGKCVVTPGIVECGVLEEKINGELGNEIARAGLDKVVLVGETLVGAVKDGYLQAGGDKEKLVVLKTLEEAKAVLASWLKTGDCVLFLNDLPDVF